MTNDDLQLALTLADTADAITLDRFRAADLSINSKPDLTPVTDADLHCERTLRNELARLRPEDEVLGEEYGGEPKTKGRQWVIDPIDGTKNFVRGVPAWATLICLLVDATPAVAVVSAPALGHRWWAAQGQGAWSRAGGSGPRHLQVSQVAALEDASVSFSSLEGWEKRGKLDGFLSLSRDTWRLRGFGDFWSYCLVAEGAADIAVEPEVSLWDLAAPSLIVTEAGGTFTGLNGKPGPGYGSAVATNGFLHAPVLHRLGDASM